MKKADVIKIFGTQAAVARFLGLTRAAVCAWKEEIPEVNAYRLRDKMPTIDRRILELRDEESQAQEGQ